MKNATRISVPWQATQRVAYPTRNATSMTSHGGWRISKSAPPAVTRALWHVEKSQRASLHQQRNTQSDAYSFRSVAGSNS